MIQMLEVKMRAIILYLLITLIPVPLFAQDIHTAVQQGNAQRVREILTEDPRLVNMKDETGRTPLHWAARSQNLDIMVLLLDQGADVNAQDDNGIAALHSLVVRGNKEGVELLLRNGADVNIVDTEGTPPLAYTMNYFIYHHDIADMLMDNGADPFLLKDQGIALLHRAATRGHERMVAYLIEKGVDTIQSNTCDLLHFISFGGIGEIVDYILKKDCNVDEKDRYGMTPLHYAAAKGHRQVMEILLSGGANIDVKNTINQTPYQLASQAGYEELADLLKENGAYAQLKERTELTGEYFGLKKPELEPELFAPGIVSTFQWEHSSPTFLPDKSMIFWFEILEDASKDCMKYSEMKNGYWTIPERFPFVPEGTGIYPHYSKAGNRLLFHSRQPIDKNDTSKTERIWAIDKTENGWSEPYPLNPIINDGSPFRSFSIADDGTLYISSRREDCLGGFDIYYSELVNGGYIELKHLSPDVNSTHSELLPAVSPDEDFIIFMSNKPEGFGRNDFYISFRNSDGTWTPSKNMGTRINTEHDESFPMVSPDKKFFFFGSDRNGNIGDIYWVDVKILDQLRPNNLE